MENGLDAIVFDFDGLILDTEWSSYVSVSEVFMDHGTVLDLELWKTFIGSTDHPHWTDILEAQVVVPFDRESAIAARQRRRDALLAPLGPNEGIVDLLEAAGSRGVRRAVASSSQRSWVVGNLERLDLIGHFDVIATGDQVAMTKPAPDVYLLALDSLGVDPSRSVAIEDSANGCRAARAAGMAVVAVPTRLTEGTDFSTADLIVDSVASIDLATLAALVAR